MTESGIDRIFVRCCIAGGGPAGMMLGLLLARSGVEVLVLEKHSDFLRDFRGDTIHPSTLEVMHELGMLENLLALPHQKAPVLKAQFGDLSLEIADFSHLPTRCKFIAMMPQWDFLNLLATEGRRYPGFHLRMDAEATGLIEDTGRIVGLRAATSTGPLEVRTDLVVAADGRHSVLRKTAALGIEQLGAPMDVLWFRLRREPGDSADVMGRFGSGHIFIMINRGDYWQCGFVIRKGSIEEVRARGLEAFRAAVVKAAAFTAGRVGELKDWEDVKLLTVSVDRMPRWYRGGVLFIGDAAHAMSPIGGVGINLAIQDAVAAANILAQPLRDNKLETAHLEAVQRRREWPTRVTQRMQIFMQDRVVTRALDDAEAFEPPLLIRLMARFPLLRRIPARLFGMGVRPEHVQIR
ncbi:MAG TPA: FAD-dependent oxidoreductase [Burkholderiales bacterium]|nr:FAD-dependent oxidoreductase [Burkholderiales bacterium]